jgi:thioredoxin reductase/ferredoxin
VEVGKDITLDQLRKEGYEAFYLAIGAQGGRKIGIEGEDAAGVIAGVDFLREVNLGNAKKISGKAVIVGGGNVAIDVARTAKRQGADTAFMYCLEKREEMPALPDEMEEAEKDGVTFENGWGPKRILTKNGKVTGVDFKRCISVFDGNHRFAPKYDENDTITVEADVVLLSIGQSVEWGGLIEGSHVQLKKNNTVQADDFTYQTDEPDVFTGGDCYTGPKFAIHAIAAGKEGAISIHRYVQPGQTLTYGRDRREYHAFDKENVAIGINDFDNTPRQRAEYKEVEQGSYEDDRATFTEEQMKKETQRCLGCGAVQVDSYMCIGCGMCTTKCKFDAIHMIRAYNTVPAAYEKLPVKIATNAIKRSGKIVKASILDKFSKEE